MKATLRRLSIRREKKQMGTDAESRCDPFDIVDRDVALASLNTTIICAVHLDFVGKILLAQATRQTIATDIRRYCAPEQTRMRALHTA